MRHPMSSSSDSGNESPYEVYWKSESNLSSIAALQTSAVVPTRTPLKRNTTAALLPSPSTSTSQARAPRERKKRRPARGGVAVTPVGAAVERMDEATLKTMEVLAARLRGRSVGTPSSAARRVEGRREPVPVSAASVPDKGKGRQMESHQSGLTARRSLPLALPGPAPLRPSSSGQLLASKPFLPAQSKRAQLPLGIPDTPLLSKSILSSKPALSPETDEFDSYFTDDQDFELALSQLEDFESLPTSSIHIQPRKRSPVSSLVRVAGPSIRSSPRIASKAATVPSRAIPPPPQPILRHPALQTPRSDLRLVTPVMPVVKPGFRVGNVASKVKAASPKRAIIVRGSVPGGSQLEGQAMVDMEALLEGVGDWSDEDF